MYYGSARPSAARNCRSLLPHTAEDIHTGESVAVNGCCLTVSAHRAEQLTFDLLDETLQRTNLTKLRRDSPVNMERPLAAGGRLGGHFVQGHIDCAAKIVSLTQVDGDHRLEIELPPEFAHYVACKGSIAINGISLTIAEPSAKKFCRLHYSTDPALNQSSECAGR